MNKEVCLFCFEDINFTETLRKPSQCSCKVLLHQNCMQLIENTGLMCPICRIKKSPNIIIIVNIENENSFLLKFFANKVFNYFATSPNAFRFIVFFVASCCITIGLIPKLIWLGLNEQTYRVKIIVFIGILSIISFEIISRFLFN